jgi:hypothetical protein
LEVSFQRKPAQAGALYLLNAGPGKTGALEYNILFPLTATEWAHMARAEVGCQTGGGPDHAIRLVSICRSARRRETLDYLVGQPIPELDEIFRQAAANKQNPGVVAILCRLP